MNPYTLYPIITAPHRSFNFRSDEVNLFSFILILSVQVKDTYISKISTTDDSMTTNPISTPPAVLWAQRSTRVFLTFNVECEKPDIKFDKNALAFKGTCAPDQKLHEVNIPLYGEINPAKCAFVNKGRLIEVILAKEKTDEPFWPTLTSDKKKHHWLKVDFERWQDEDESGAEDFEGMDMFSNNIEDLEEKNETSSSDEEDLPDIQ